MTATEIRALDRVIRVACDIAGVPHVTWTMETVLVLHTVRHPAALLSLQGAARGILMTLGPTVLHRVVLELDRR